MSKKVGVVGLGAMGGIYVRHLMSADFKVAGHDLIEDYVGALKKLGMEGCQSPKEVAEASDVLITSLPSSHALESVVQGDKGVLESGKEALIIIDTCTLKVEDKLAIGNSVSAAGMFFLDAPISGTPPMVENREASLYVCGDKKAYEQCKDIIEAFTGTNFFVGNIGDASKMKILANYLVGVHTVAAAECMVLGIKAGLDPNLIHEVLPKGAGGSKMLEVRGEYMAKSDYRYDEGTIFNVIQKDSSIISEYAASLNSPINLFASARQTFNSAVALGLSHMELAAVCKAVEISAGVDRPLIE